MGGVRSPRAWRDAGSSHADRNEPFHCLLPGPQRSHFLPSLPSPLLPVAFLPKSAERDFPRMQITKGHDLML